MSGARAKAPAVPPAGAYDPLRALGRPGGKPAHKPRFRILLHKRDWAVWQKLVAEAGKENAQQLWDHLAHRADLPPLLGTCTPLKGGHVAKTADGWSRVHHYEVSGPGRVNYRYHHKYKGGQTREEHMCVKIVDIDLSSH